MDSDRTFDLHSSQLFLSEKLHVPEFFSIPADNGIHLPAALIRPKTPPTEKLPVVVEVYGGPGSPIATNRWRGVRPLYRELLARRGIATFLIDNRSSAGRGMKDAWEIKGHVGEIELQDLRTGIRWLKEQDWVDADRLLIRGWSFGGFMTMTAMTRTTDFKAGIAGAQSLIGENMMPSTRRGTWGYLLTMKLAIARLLRFNTLGICTAQSC